MVGIKIEVDDKEANRVLSDMVRRIANPQPVFDEIGKYLIASVINRFETESGPGGVPWKKSRRAERTGGKTLRDRGHLVGSITHNVLPDGVEVGTNLVYGAIHQLGGRTPPRTIRPKRKRALYWPGAAHPVRSVNHPGSDIPARPFLGIDDQDRAAIRRIIGRHLGID